MESSLLLYICNKQRILFINSELMMTLDLQENLLNQIQYLNLKGKYKIVLVYLNVYTNFCKYYIFVNITFFNKNLKTKKILTITTKNTKFNKFYYYR